MITRKSNREISRLRERKNRFKESSGNRLKMKDFLKATMNYHNFSVITCSQNGEVISDKTVGLDTHDLSYFGDVDIIEIRFLKNEVVLYIQDDSADFLSDYMD